MKGSVVKFVEMASLTECQREINYFLDKEFNGGGAKFKNKDTLFARISPCLQNGKICKVSGLLEDEIANGSTEFIVLSPKYQLNDEDFVYYTSLTKEFRATAEKLMEGTSGRQRVSWQLLSEIDIFIPPPEIRNKIGIVLRTLDDKIELNKKINQTLESIAQAMFKSWFVDFDPVHAKANANSEDDYDAIAKDLGISREILDLFPSEFEESELGLIPKGWGIDEIGNIINVVGGGTPNTKNKEFWENGNIHWTTPKDLSSLDFPVLLDTERKITEKGLTKISSGLLKEGTFLLSSRAPIGYTAISQIPVAINQGFIAMPPNQRLSSIFLLYWTQNNIDNIKNYSGGTTFQEISKKNFRLIKIIMPSVELLNEFNRLASNLFDNMINKEKENKILVDIRDILLPKILSGEIDVSNLILEPEND